MRLPPDGAPMIGIDNTNKRRRSARISARGAYQDTVRI
jgi:hypothetical protein